VFGALGIFVLGCAAIRATARGADARTRAAAEGSADVTVKEFNQWSGRVAHFSASTPESRTVGSEDEGVPHFSWFSRSGSKLT